MTFVNYRILADDNPSIGSQCLDVDIYLEDGNKYRLYLLFFDLESKEWRELEILSDEILPDLYFENAGICLRCGRWVSDPTKMDYDDKLVPGVFNDTDWSWYCNTCFKNIRES